MEQRLWQEIINKGLTEWRRVFRRLGLPVFHCMCVSLSVGTDMYMQVPEEAREGARSPGVEVTGDHEIPDMDDGKKTSRSLEEQTLFQSQTGCSL